MSSIFIAVYLCCKAGTAAGEAVTGIIGAFLYEYRANDSSLINISPYMTSELWTSLVMSLTLVVFMCWNAHSFGFVHALIIKPQTTKTEDEPDGVFYGDQTIIFGSYWLRSEMRLGVSDVHMAGATRIRRFGDLAIFDLDYWGGSIFYALKGQTTDAKAAKGLLKKMRRSALKTDQWAIDSNDPEYFDLEPAKLQSLRSDQIEGFKESQKIRTNQIFAFLLFAVIFLCEAYVLFMTDLPVKFVSIVTLLTTPVISILWFPDARKQLAILFRIRPRIGAPRPNVDCGPAVAKVSLDGLQVCRRLQQDYFKWAAFTSVTEYQGCLIFRNKDSILAIVPARDEIKALLPRVGLVRPTGPWGTSNKGEPEWHAA
ncbi:MAG: hypothetical protein ABJ327_16700 [Litoreibacter sp.]